MQKKLTELTIKSAKAQGKEYELREPGGLLLRVRPSGGKSFYYLYTCAGKRHKLCLGEYPYTSLSEAREKHLEAQLMVRQGINPKAPQQPTTATQEETQEALTVERLCKKYYEEYCTHNTKNFEETKRVLNRYIVAKIGDREATAIRRKDAIKIIDDLSAATPGMARQVLKTARAMYTWALEREMVDLNPFSRVSKAVPAVKGNDRERVLTDEEIRKVWAILTNPKEDIRSTDTRRALQLILITGQRPGECSGIRYEEINGDWWTIPAERSKNGKESAVYLSPLAKYIVGSMKDEHGKKLSGPVFGGPWGEGLARHALSHYVAKGDKDSKREGYFGLSRWTPHDLRRTAATGLSRLGCPDEAVDAILNHQKQGVIRVYNRHKYEAEKQQWLTAWGEYLLSLIK